MDEQSESLWGIMILEYEGEHYYHIVRAERYDGLISNMGRLGMRLKAGKNNLNDKRIREYI